jgi:hypothetical protein
MAPTIEPAPIRTIRLTPEELTARKRRNLWIALGLVAFMVLLFTTTFLRMMHNQKAAREARAAVAATAPLAPSAPATPSAPAGN